jgi:hypothetical protein
MDSQVDRNEDPCIACGRVHALGSCPLKMAGVEHCGLCGIAHFGFARTCPHLRSDLQVTRMIDALKQSTEDPHLVALAKKYCYGIKGDLAQRKKRASSKTVGGLGNHTVASTPPTQNTAASAADIPSARQPVVYLTGHSNG